MKINWKTFMSSALALGCLIISFLCQSQTKKPFLSNLHAGSKAPLYTGYAAAMQRSTFTPDQGWRFVYDTDSIGANFVTEKIGEVGIAFYRNHQWVNKVGEMYIKPVITLSYPDMVRYYFYPVKDLRVDVVMVVYSSTTTFWDVRIKNESSQGINFDVFPFIKISNTSFHHIKEGSSANEIFFEHMDIPDGWVTSHNIPYTKNIRSLLRTNLNSAQPLYSEHCHLDELISSGLNSHSDSARLIGLKNHFELAAHQSAHFRFSRIIQSQEKLSSELQSEARATDNLKIDSFQKANEKLFAKTPPSPFKDSASMYLYWSACNMMHQVFLPPEGNLTYNYYVFSREPHWGWGHGGQVFHESISMLAYAFIDPKSAMNSQRVFAERQHPNGYINYRTGPYLDEVIEKNGALTSSAPWYSWLNWEVFKITKDTAFLKEMYQSSEKFYNFFVSNRDKDHDGLCEWGGEAILESVRDSKVAVWDQVGYPANFESIDLNCMLVMEAKSLEKMAGILHLNKEAEGWRKDYQKRSALIDKTFWDPETQFYYNVDMKNNSFMFKNKNDLKRKEIIGFMPLWAGIASKSQAASLVKHLTDTSSFWRRYGVPSLAADDPYYQPRGYWNGPVWIQWDYLIERGLLEYGYKKIAREMVDKVKENMIGVLKKNHELWEFYDPDSIWGGYHRTYIWAGIINRMMMDLK